MRRLLALRMLLFLGTFERGRGMFLPEAPERVVSEKVDWADVGVGNLMLYEHSMGSTIHCTKRTIIAEGRKTQSQRGNWDLKRACLGHVRFERHNNSTLWHISKLHVQKDYRGRGLGSRLLKFLLSRHPQSAFYLYSDWNNPEFSPNISFRCYVKSALSSRFRVYLSYNGTFKPRSLRLNVYDKIIPNINGEWLEISDYGNLTSNPNLFPRRQGLMPAITPKSRFSSCPVESWRVLLLLPKDSSGSSSIGGRPVAETLSLPLDLSRRRSTALACRTTTSSSSAADDGDDDR